MNIDTTYQPEGGIWAPYRLPFLGAPAAQEAGVCHLNVADIFAAVHLNLETGQFETDALKSTDLVAGKMAKALKTAAGAAFGAAFGVMSQGAKELDSATQKLAADTGMTAEAAKQAGSAIAGMYQNNLQSFAQIGATMAVVINGLDLTGAAADAMTEKFLKFETATGQDSTAVSAFHEILNAWGLDASSAPHIMDLLVASHQKYGSSIADNQASLQRLAPQMKAMNMTIDDTVNLLNLFDAAGLDASKAQFALNTAVKNLKPGQSFNDLIAQVTAVTDPTLRAQEAIKLFGARGGVGLANALKPGITSLSDFATSASDTAGATDKAAAAIESSWTNVATKIVHTIEGPLAEIGQSIMPLMLVGSLFGPKVLAVVGGAAGLFGSQIGFTAGTAMSGAFGAALIIGLPIALAAAMLAIGPKVQDLGEWFYNATFGKVLGETNLADLKKLSDMPAGPERDAAAANPRAPVSPTDTATASAQARMAAALAGTRTAAKLALTESLDQARIGIDALGALYKGAGAAAILQAAKDGYIGIPTAMQAAQFEAGLALQKGIDDKLTAIKNSRSGFISAWSDAMDSTIRPGELRRQEKNVEETIAALQKKIAAGSQSTADMQHNLNVEALAEAEKQHFLLLAEDATYGTKDQKIAKLNGLLHSQYYLDGLASKDPETAQYWATLGTKTQAQIDVLNGIFNTGGASAGGAFLASLIAALSSSQANDALDNEAIKIQRRLYPGGQPPTSSPPVTVTPPHGARARGGPVEAGYPYLVNENTPQSEIFVPQTAGTIVPSGQFGGTTTNNITVNASFGNDVSLGAAKRFEQTIADVTAKVLQQQGSRYSEFSGSRP